MKKLLALLVVLASVLALASCLGSTPTPEPPAPDETVGECFSYSLLDNGSYSIVGLTDEGKKAKTLTVPLEYEGKKVTVIAADALKGGVAETLIITEDTNVRNIMTGAFNGASSLRSLYIYFAQEAELAPPTNFSGTNSDFTIYVPEGSFYDTDYYWSQIPGIENMLQFIGD